MNTLTIILCIIAAPVVLAFLFFILPAFFLPVPARVYSQAGRTQTGEKSNEGKRVPGVQLRRVRDGYPVVLPLTEAMKASQSGKFEILGNAVHDIEADKRFEDLAE